MPRSRATRIALLTTTGFLLVAAAWEFVWLWRYVGSLNAIGSDYIFFRDVGERWLQTGVFYLPHQLAGPYVVVPNVDVLYPPIALVLFVPFVWLPAVLWWATPAVVVGIVLWRLRPAMWTWPIIALLIAWPRGVSNIIYGNSDIWIVAAVAGGVLWSWPATLVAIKPSVAFFALIGIRHRPWWVSAGFLALVSIPLLGLWLDYPTVISNSDLHWWYSIEDMPPMFIGVIAWMGRRDAPHPWRIQLRHPWLVRRIEST
jgi:hypothetical protein